jgi:hypothetical protein
MDKRNLITITLLLSALVFTPLIAQEGEQHYTITQVKPASISDEITSVLYDQGLDEDAAVRMTAQLINEDDTRFTLMTETLLASCKTLKREELIAYLSREALYRQPVSLHSYGQLVGMLTKIKQQTPDRETLQKLSHIAKFNERIVNS